MGEGNTSFKFARFVADLHTTGNMYTQGAAPGSVLDFDQCCNWLRDAGVPGNSLKDLYIKHASRNTRFRFIVPAQTFADGAQMQPLVARGDVTDLVKRVGQNLAVYLLSSSLGIANRRFQV